LVFIIRILKGEISLLQNNNWLLLSNYLKEILGHYKIKIGFYILLSSGYLKRKFQYYKIIIRNN
jgi:hypothetical protein